MAAQVTHWKNIPGAEPTFNTSSPTCRQNRDRATLTVASLDPLNGDEVAPVQQHSGRVGSRPQHQARHVGRVHGRTKRLQPGWGSSAVTSGTWRVGEQQGSLCGTGSRPVIVSRPPSEPPSVPPPASAPPLTVAIRKAAHSSTWGHFAATVAKTCFLSCIWSCVCPRKPGEESVAWKCVQG